MKISKEDKNSKKRDDPRIEYSGHIFFISKDGFNEGELANYSEHGLFIETANKLPVGTIITIALPYLDGHVKRQGQVVRTDKNGFGVELFRQDSEPFQRVSPRQMNIK